MWTGVPMLASATLLGGCGNDDGSAQDADDTSQAPTDNPAAVYDGAWSGSLSTGGSIEFTVSDGVITAARIASGDGVFGPRCGVVSGENDFPDEEIAIEDGQFSWGGSGEGYPVEGRFDSETTASGSAQFSPPEVSGEPAAGCREVVATWEATTGEATDTGTSTGGVTETNTPTEERDEGAAVSAAAARCVGDLGYEITAANATDLPIADADGEGLPVVDGSAGIGIRGGQGAAVFFVYETPDQANTAYLGSTSNPDINLVAPRVDAIAIDNVLVMSDAGFVSDDRFYLADCFD